MHISSQTVSSMMANAMNSAYANYSDIIQRIASNKNFTKVSDNVGDAINVLKIKDQISELEGYQGNVEHAINEMNLAYDTLSNVTSELSNINGLIVAASTGSTTIDSAKAYASEIKERIGTITDLMNTKYLDNYIFAGTFINEMPYTYDEDGNILYNGSSKANGDRNLMISKDTKFSYNLTGEEIFGEQDGVNDFFAQMKELVSLLNCEDSEDLDFDKIRSKLNVIEKATNNVAQKNGLISSKVSKLMATQEINSDTISNLTEKRAGMEEVDIVKAASDLAAANTGLQASYMLGTRILSSVSLLDYL